ncbi:PAS domain-containing sensor histidine kinase [Clostridium chromiireducens]|uniref:PAS domain-containing sensor histidine kinase n=1 Tax=Clostridium chromiireducens TaxID=225345 RepID=UPI003AF6CF0B
MQSIDFIDKARSIETIDNNQSDQALMIVRNDTVVNASESFFYMTEYLKEDIINKNITEILKKLRLGPDINFEDLDNGKSYFLFTKSLEVRFINVEVLRSSEQQIYILTEKQNSRFQENNQFLERLISENKTGIGVFTASDLILINANQSYLNNFSNKYNSKEKFYGKSLSEVVTNFDDSDIKEAFNDVVANNRPLYFKELSPSLYKDINKFYDHTLMPIVVNNRVDYIVVMAENAGIKEHVIKQSEEIEQRNKQLEAIFESIDHAIFIYDAHGNYYMTNKAAKDLYPNGEMNRLGDVFDDYKYYDPNGNEIKSENITISKLFRGEVVTNDFMTLRNRDTIKHISASGRPVYDKDGNIKFVVMCYHDITDLVEKEKQIKSQKELLENIIQNTSNHIFIFDKLGKLLLMNKEAYKDIPLGHKLENIDDFYAIGDHYSEDGRILTKEELPVCRSIKGEIIEREKIIIKSLKKELVFEFRSSPIYDSDGNIECIMTYAHNITELVNQNKIIGQQKELLQSIIQNMSEAVVVYDRNKNVFLKNDAAKNIIYNCEEFNRYKDILNTTKCFDSVGNEILEQDLPTAISFRGGKVNNSLITFQRPDKSIHCRISSSPIFDEYGRINNVVVCMHNVTGFIKQRNRVKEQKEQLEAILNSMQESILVFDKDGKFIIKNNSASHLLNDIAFNMGNYYEVKSFFNMDGSKLSFEELPVNCAMQGKIIKGKVIYFEANGKKEYVMINAVPVFDSCGKFSYGIVNNLIITDLIESQQKLESAQKQLLKAKREKIEALEKALAMKDEFLSLISHEFRTPINVISTAVQALNYIYGNELSDKVKGYLGTIRQNTFRQLRLVNNLLDITRANAGRIKVNKKNIDIVFITKAIVESVYDYAAQKGVRVSLVSSFKKKIIAMDDEKYERIILNLISNAIKFTPTGKSITVCLHTVKGNTCIEVKDNGIGIPQDKVDVIFERFGQVDSSLSRQAEGTGIGLSLVKMFVQALGGSISVKSKVGKGSTFIVIFPDETIVEEEKTVNVENFMNNRLIEVTNVEFSDIYL